VLVGPPDTGPKAGADEASTAQYRPAESDLIGAQKLAVDAEAALKSNMFGEGGRAIGCPSEEEVADRMEQRIDTESQLELVPRRGAQLGETDVELRAELLPDTTTVMGRVGCSKEATIEERDLRAAVCERHCAGQPDAATTDHDNLCRSHRGHGRTVDNAENNSWPRSVIMRSPDGEIEAFDPSEATSHRRARWACEGIPSDACG
jgi:hypothetical protein